MKTAASIFRPRLVCRVVRQWCAVFDRGDSRHIASCSDCQEYFRTVDALDAALRRDAVRSASGPSDELERQILRAVRNATPARKTAPSPLWGAPWMAGAAAAAIAVAAVFMQRGNDSLPSRAAIDPNAGAAVMADAVQSLSHQFVGKVIPTTGEFVANNPLQQEIGSVYADARSAIGFLAMNFLPSVSSPEDPLPGRQI